MKSRFSLGLMALLPSFVLAHPGHLETDHALMSGILHPLGGLDHLLAMVAVGLWAALLGQQTKKAIWAVPMSFVVVMIVCFVVGLNIGEVPMSEQAIAASVLVMGLAAAWAKQVPVVLASVMVAAFAFFHGVAHGAEMGEGTAGLFALGFVLSTVALHLVGVSIGVGLYKHHGLSRTIGTAIGLAGIGFFFA